jgi:serine/threonine-protein kinase SRPK3
VTFFKLPSLRLAPILFNGAFSLHSFYFSQRALITILESLIRDPSHHHIELSHIDSMWNPVYQFSILDKVENLEMYQAGGHHPVTVGQVMKGRPYEIVHKLGYGGIATAWLARDLAFERGVSTFGPLVCLKVVSSAESQHDVEGSAEVQIPRALRHSPALSGETRDFVRAHLLPTAEPFMEEGPNGSHLCLVSEVAGPSISDIYGNIAMSGRFPGSVRLRFDLAHAVASQVARFIHAMHTAGCVHGGKYRLV